MFNNLLSKLAVVASIAVVGLGVVTSPAHARPVHAPNPTDDLEIQKVPEPASILGLLAFSTVGAVSSLKRKKKHIA